MTRDHNLLFDVFAVHLGKVTAMRLMDVASAWASDISRDIPSRLKALNILSMADREFLERLVTEAVAAHRGGAVKRTVPSFSAKAPIPAGSTNVLRCC